MCHQLRVMVGIAIILLLSGSASAATESRYVWDANMGSNLTFTWTPINFDGFYYDLDNNAGNESLTIMLDSNTDRTINENNLIYTTSSGTIPFKNKPFGNYNIIGFMSEKYFAGYSSSTTIPDVNPISTLDYKQLHIVLIDDDSVRSINGGSILELGEGYALKINEVNSSLRTVEISLLKCGSEIDNAIISGGHDTYIYSKNVGTISNLPIIVIHIGSVFVGNETTVVFLDGIFQISEIYSSINMGDAYGSMNITSISNNEIIMNNSDTTISLSRNSIVDIMGNLKFNVSDSDVLRFYPHNIDILERRGTVSTISNNISVWDAFNFAGFFYNINYNLGTENLSITTSGTDNRTIVENDMVYSTSVQEKPLYVVNERYSNASEAIANGLEGFGAGAMATGSGNYSIIGWQGEPYVAIKGKTNKLAKIIYEQTPTSKKTLILNDIWDIGDGYTITAQSIDSSTSPRQAWLALKKDGVNLDDKIIFQGHIYTYTKASLASETDVPIIVTYLDSVFKGATTDILQLKYTWLISSNVTIINSGDKFGIFNVTEVNSESIILKNENTVNLTTGNISIMDKINFSVADSSDLRYYPYKSVNNSGSSTEREISYHSKFLRNGWNLISLPLVPLDSNDLENTSIQRITSSISDNIIKIVSYNSTALALGEPPWEVYYPGDEVNSTLNELKTGQGYFIKTNESTYLNIYGVRVYEDPRSYNMTQGWNLMGYHSTSSTPVETALYNIQGNFSSLWMLENDWISYFGEQFYNMEPGYGYWIFMNQSGEVPQN